MNLLSELFVDMLLGSVPAVGFGMLFNVPKKILWFCAAGGAVGHGLRFLFMRGGIPIEWGTLLAASTVSLIGVWVAQRLQAHPKVFTVASMIPMVPGVKAYTAVIAIVQINQRGYSEELFRVFVQNLLATTFIISALAIGLAMPGLLLYRRKPVV